MVWHRASGCFLTLKSPVFRSLIYFKFANVTGRSEWQRGVAEFKKWEVGAPNLPTKSRALQRSPSLTSKLQPNRVAISMLSKGSISAAGGGDGGGDGGGAPLVSRRHPSQKYCIARSLRIPRARSALGDQEKRLRGTRALPPNLQSEPDSLTDGVLRSGGAYDERDHKHERKRRRKRRERERAIAYLF